MGATLEIQDSINFAQPFLSFYPLNVNATGQPAIHIANVVAQLILAPPFKWRWNRNAINWLTTNGVQTYQPAAAWQATHAYTAGNVIIDSNGNGEKVLVGGTSGGTAPTWATGIFVTTTDSGVTWQNIGPIANIASASDFGFIEKAFVQDVNNGSVWKEIQPRLDLSRDSSTGCPKYISAQSDDDAGDIAFRLMPTPAAAYPISVQYQKQQALFTAVANLWSPIPDFMFYTYSFGFLALALAYKSDSRFPWASQHFITNLLSNAEGLTETEINIFLRTWGGITNTLTLDALKQSQGNQARLVG